MAKGSEEQRLDLINAQQRLRAEGRSAVVVVAGVDGSGRHRLVNALTHGLDTRGVKVHAWSREDAPGSDRPPLWKYWQGLPARGQVAVYLDGWYAEPLDRALRGASPDLSAIRQLEAQLIGHGSVLVKLWVERPLAEARRDLRKRLKREARDPTLSEQRVLAAEDGAQDQLDALRARSEGWTMLSGKAPEVAADQAREALIAAMSAPTPPVPVPGHHRNRGAQALAALDMGAALSKKASNKQLPEAQAELARRIWAARARGQSTVVVLEGADAAGKGGVIRRLTDPLDARLFQVVPVAAPSDEERARPYLWRFWRHLPKAGQVLIFDRSWYGRVLVERVEAFCRRDEWQRAFDEINDFEAQLVDHGAVVRKFWLHISPEEQLKRFEDRAETPHKRHKLTDEDWRNREKWDDYRVAVEDAVARTHSAAAPWTLVPANCKRHARLAVIQTLIDALAPD